MKIYIKQDMVTVFGRRYVIWDEEKELYSIRRLWLTPIPKFKIKDFSNNTIIGRIQNKFSVRGNAEIVIPGGTYKFDQESINSMTYICNQMDGNKDTYLIRGHKGLVFSIFKNKQQIGRWTKESVVMFGGDSYNLELDYDADVVLISALAILLDTFRISVTIGGDIGFDIGNIGKDLKDKQSNWTPKTKN